MVQMFGYSIRTKRCNPGKEFGDFVMLKTVGARLLETIDSGLKVVAFPVGDYVEHLVAGTRRMWSGRWDPKPGESAGPWKEKGNWPI